jgi:tetratricopeptide (TPR) repeat protein
VANYYLFDQQPVPAIEAFDKVLKWDDDNADALRGRGDAYLNLGKHAEAIADFNAALETDPENDGLLNNLAWVLATSPMDDQRNGQRAIELATKACELTAYEMPHILSTLAAAYAETGEWETAIKYSEQAVEKGKDGLNADDLAAELASYKEHKPWREEHPLTVEGNSDQAPDDEPNAESQTSVPPATEPAPARTSDF